MYNGTLNTLMNEHFWDELECHRPSDLTNALVANPYSLLRRVNITAIEGILYGMFKKHMLWTRVHKPLAL